MQCAHKFTRKEYDLETGWYYHGARYYDPKLSRWISADPPLARGDYLPVPPVSDEAKEHNSKLPGMGGVFNSINLDAYHYAGQNPVKFVDPDGNSTWVDKENNVVDVKNDKNLGIYRVGDKKMKHKLGETRFWNSFLTSSGKAKGHINFGDNKAETILRQKVNEAKEMSLWKVAKESMATGDLDVKKGQAYEGYLFNGKYVSMRDVGNILYGINVYNKNIDFSTAMKAAGGYAATGNRWDALLGMFGKEYGPPPYYGEEEITGTRIEFGYSIAPNFK